ncbi:MAG: hypothetical protein R2735_05540 [Microthrixaceae bacterium]
MDETDYQRLRAGYTARAAEVIRRIESGGTVAAGKADSLDASPRRSRVKVVGVSALIIGFAVASGAGCPLDRATGIESDHRIIRIDPGAVGYVSAAQLPEA